MFDVGFSELVLLFIIGLLVLGPEKLPRVANTIGGWVGQARRMTRMLKRQIEEELELNKVRETVNQPLSSVWDPTKPKPAEKPVERPYEEGDDDESGFGETGHKDAAELEEDGRPTGAADDDTSGVDGEPPPSEPGVKSDEADADKGERRASS